MSTATAPKIDEDAAHRLRVIAGMKTNTFKELFHGEFDNLRKALAVGDEEEITNTIEALEACAVDACRKHDELWRLLNHEC